MFLFVTAVAFVSMICYCKQRVSHCWRFVVVANLTRESMGRHVTLHVHIIFNLGQPVFVISPYNAVCLAGEA